MVLDWIKNKARGNIGEIIIEMLIDSMEDWECVKFGVENHVNHLKKCLGRNPTPESKKIRYMPDFVAINKKTNKIFLLDVKFRSFVNEETKFLFNKEQMQDYLEYWKEMKFIFVIPFAPYFVVIDLKDIKGEMCGEEQIGNGYLWDFDGIIKKIQELFPDLEEEVFEEAIKLIPYRKD